MSKTGIDRIRDFHKTIKEREISRFVSPGDHVVELGCGVGGDYFKHVRAGAGRVSSFDLSSSNIKEAKRRAQNAGMHDEPTRLLVEQSQWAVCDATKEDDLKSAARLVGREEADVLSCQFVLQYLCEAEEVLQRFFDWAATILKRGGLIIATAPDGEAIRRLTSGGGIFKSSTLLIEKEASSFNISDFGHPVKFSLIESRLAQDVKEFLLPKHKFVSVAKERGFRLVELKPFSEHYSKSRKLTREEEEASFLNFSVVFQRV